MAVLVLLRKVTKQQTFFLLLFLLKMLIILVNEASLFSRNMNRKTRHLVLSEVVEDLVHPGENLLSARDRLALLLDLTGWTGLTCLTSGRVEVLLFYFNLKNYGGKLAKHYYVI